MPERQTTKQKPKSAARLGTDYKMMHLSLSIELNEYNKLSGEEKRQTGSQHPIGESLRIIPKT